MLARSQLEVFEKTHGQFFWNFRTELEPRWSYIEAVKRGWLPSAWDSYTTESLSICSSVMRTNEDTRYFSHGSSTYILFAGVLVLSGLIVYMFQRKIRSSHANKYSVIGDVEDIELMKMPMSSSFIHSSGYQSEGYMVASSWLDYHKVEEGREFNL